MKKRVYHHIFLFFIITTLFVSFAKSSTYNCCEDGCCNSCEGQHEENMCDGHGDCSGVCQDDCGDGDINNDEVCDSNTRSCTVGGYNGRKTCNSDCSGYKSCVPIEYCGDGTTQTAAGEECDDKNSNNNDDCTNNCKNARCMDGFVWNQQNGNEECDDGNAVNTDSCLNTCKNAYCGDGIAWANVEECDDGNAVNTDSCIIDTSNNYVCKNAYCSDGYTHSGVEECDDSNTNNNDACIIDPVKNYMCKDAYCRDGYLQSGIEDCDDANYDPYDECNNECTFACGDGVVDPSEQCDDENTVDGDGCTNCLVDVGYVCQHAPSICSSDCGDGSINSELGELCDDGNEINNDGCSRTCQIEQGYKCIGTENSVCDTICGDGLVVSNALNPINNEECDSALDKCCTEETCILQENLYKSFFIDSDGDGYGFTEERLCTLESIDTDKFKEKSGDCDESNSQINPGAQEKCSENIDYDCDGNPYNGCSCKEGILIDCQKQGGVCAGYKLICSTGEVPSCNWIDDVSNYQDVEKTCDNLDNDCDGIVDEGCDDDFDLHADSELVCNGQFLDGLKNIRSCSDYSGDCDDTDKKIFLGNKEICNGLDDDCDGNIDNLNDKDIPNCFTLTEFSQLKPIGVCQKITAVCTDAVLNCQINNFEKIETTCDNLDNDCDGEIDEDCSCSSGQTKKCGSNLGECVQGIQTCGEDESWGECIGSVSPDEEICDSKDNDCDNLVDEGSDVSCVENGCPGKKKCVNGALTVCDATCSNTNIKITLTKEDINQFIQEADLSTEDVNLAHKTIEVVDQSIDYVYDSDKTVIKNNIASDKKLQDFEYTLFIPKCLTKYLDDIDFQNNNYTIIEEDPVIAWHFVEVRDSIDLSYEVQGQISPQCLEKIKGLPIAKVIGAKNEGGKFNVWLVIIPIIVAIGLAIGLAATKKPEEKVLESEQDYQNDFIQKRREMVLERIKRMKFQSKMQADNYMRNLGYTLEDREWIIKRL